MVEGEPEPHTCVCAPEGGVVRAGIDAKDVRHTGPRQVTIEADVVGEESLVAVSHVEGHERVLTPEL
jgi:hypothetical protein